MSESSDRLPPPANSELADRLTAVVREVAAEVHPDRSIPATLTLATTLDRDLGLDSLARVELIARIEQRFDVSLPESVFAEAQAIVDLLGALNNLSVRAPVAVPLAARTPAGATSIATPSMADTWIDVIRQHVEEQPDRVHIRLLNEALAEDPITYKALWERARQIAYGLLERGIERGDAVAIMLPTGKDYFFTFLGILIAGAVPVPIYPPVRMNQLEDHLRRHRAILANCQAKALITVPAALGLSQLLRANAETLRHILTAETLFQHGRLAPIPALKGQDTAFLQYTSGSTGNPKGVVLAHANLLANVRAMGAAVQASSSDIFVSWLPLYHDMGLIGAWLGMLYYGGTLVIMSPMTFLARPQRWLWAIHRYRGTLSAAPNFAYETCLKRVSERDTEGLDLSSWRWAFNGAEPVSPITITQFCERYAPFGFRAGTMAPVYGLAESCVGLAMPPAGRPLLIDHVKRNTFMTSGRAVPAGTDEPNPLQFVACGQPLAGHEIRVVDDQQRELPDRQQGRLQFRGPSATAGYHRNPDATASLIKGDWLEPGDLAYIAAGDVYITGRTKDMIIRGGRNIFPQELEEAIGDLRGVRRGRVAVFPSTDPSAGTERLIVLAETNESNDAAREELRLRINALATDLAGAPPDDVVLAPPGTVLKTSSGKIRRSASRDLYERGAIGQRPRPVWQQTLRLVTSSLGPLLQRAKNTAIASLYAAYAWTVWTTAALCGWVLVAVLPIRRWRLAALQWLARALAAATGIHGSVTGAEHLAAQGQGFVVVANHASYVDTFVLFALVPPVAAFVAKAELRVKFISRFFLERIGTQFAERFDQQQSLADARRFVQLLRDGHALFFFPEGTFTRMPGLLPFHMGAFSAAAEAGVPVIPIAINGTRSILREGSWFPRRGAVKVTIGAPLDTAQLRRADQLDLWQTALRLRAEARAFILAHSGEPDLAREHFPL
jgi:acyl carrier protein